MPDSTKQQRQAILESLRDLPLKIRSTANLVDLASGRSSISDLSELDVEDLLDRHGVEPDQALLKGTVHQKVVLVTGAGGSIGSELCRQILRCNPKTLLLLEFNEYALYQLEQQLQLMQQAEIQNRTLSVQVIPLLGSALNRLRVAEIMRLWRPETVYHAAAYKHVPLVEHNPVEGIRNNVFGTLICAEAALEYNVRNFVLISTDKAVRPTNIMGASKRIAELILQSLSDSNASTDQSTISTHRTCFSMVRFGNVLDSSGSVVPLFRSQIKAGGPVTVTHPDVTRYFMTIPEACQLVLQAATMSRGGEVFVLDMGAPVRIFDLARRMIRLSGLKLRTDDDPTGDIDIVITGLRPGEKLFEELLIGNNPEHTQHPSIMMATEASLRFNELVSQLGELSAALDLNDIEQLTKLLQRLVPEYTAERSIVDWTYLEQQKVSSNN
jgi:FlaA1/EpsC-like NDP-sugar epimerase